MNNDETTIRPAFRILYGVLSIIGAFCIFLPLQTLYKTWQLNLLDTWGLLMWAMLIALLFMGLCFAYTGIVIAKSGKPPKYLLKYIERYKQKANKNV